MSILEVAKVSKNFGGVRALTDIDLRIESGELLGIIGPNGAGKTTFFNIISGVMAPSSGKIFFLDEDITRMKPNQIAKRGLVRTFQATRLFGNLSVLENIRIACHIPAKANIFGDVFGFPSSRRREYEIRKKAFDIVKLAGLENVHTELAKNLPHGHQRALGVAIALAARPTLLCLDEPVTGMNAEETRFMMRFVERMRQEGITVLLIEHSMKVVMGICTRVVVLNFGKRIAEGTCAEIQNNKAVIEAYLGRPEEDAT